MTCRCFRTAAHLAFSFALLAGIAIPGARLSAADLAELLTLFRTGEYAKCVTGTAAEIENAQYSENLRLLKLRAELELGRYGDALKTLDAALKDFPTSIQLRWLGRDVCRFNQQPERAAQFEKEIADLLKQSPWKYSIAVDQIVADRKSVV